MNDRELLVLAAKAYGLDGATYQGNEWWLESRHGLTEAMWHESTGYWNPRADDGDALRLAVQLNQEVYQGINDDHAAAFASYVDGQRIRYCIEYHDDHKGGALIATRRAIVRAAAEAGKSLQEQPQ